MSFLNEEHGGLLTNHFWRLILVVILEETQLLTNPWTLVLIGALEGTCTLGKILGVTTPNTFLGAAL
jgi:hypothetical protein